MLRGILIAWVILASLIGIGLGLFIVRDEVVAGGMLIALSLVLIGLATALIRIVSGAQHRQHLKAKPSNVRHVSRSVSRSQKHGAISAA
jgi:hypothetical protein